MVDISSSVSVVRQGQLSGVNFAVLTIESASATETFELETVINESDGGPGIDVQRVIEVKCTEDHAGTPVVRPMKWTTTDDTITIGTGPSTAACEFLVFWM